MTYEIAVSNSTKTKDIQEIDKAIEKLKLQEKRYKIWRRKSKK